MEGDNIDEKYLPASYKEKWAASAQAVGFHSTTTMSVEKEDLALQRSSNAWGSGEIESLSLNSSSDRVAVG